jgi:hypothetical protein
MYIGKSAGFSFSELDEMTFADLLSYADFLADTRSKTKEAAQSDIDRLAL